MAEYIEREALYKDVTEKYHDINAGSYPFNIVAYDMAQLIKSAPAVDVVEVVRCKDCEHFKSIDYNLNKCEEHSDGWGDHTVYVGEDDYCSFGVRKEGADNG